MIRISELQKGHIDHAVNLITVRTQAGCYSWPANRDDGNTAGSDIGCEGQRFRLNPAFDVNRLYSPVARMVARAIQVYGAIITDKGGAVVTQAEDPRPYEASHLAVPLGSGSGVAEWSNPILTATAGTRVSVGCCLPNAGVMRPCRRGRPSG